MLKIFGICNDNKFLFPCVKLLQIMSSNSSTNVDSQFSFKKLRYDGRSKKRKWEERRSDKGEGLFDSKRVCGDESFVRVKRRKYAMLLGYLGANYFGMQRNPFTRTIEEDLFKALLKADLITQESFNQIQTIQFQRAARTDKGVSAARQVVSIKLPEEVNIDKINENLDNAIRVFDIKRVTKGFNSKTQCDGRTYIYMLPTVSFAKFKSEGSQEDFRLSEDALKEINDLLDKFKGTKNFHNFTCKKSPQDPSAKRYIVSFECEPPFIRDGIEFSVLKVRGQSFMLHQIRKMVGLIIAVIKGYITMDIFNKAWTLEKINIPKAPGLGLMLDQVHYVRYNQRYGSDGLHENLDWDNVEDKVNSFKEEFIYPTIINTEINEKIMLNWLEDRLSQHNFDLVDDEAQGSDNENGDDADEDVGVFHKKSSVETDSTISEKNDAVEEFDGCKKTSESGLLENIQKESNSASVN